MKVIIDAILYMYTHITTGSDRDYVTLTFKVIRGHLRSFEFTDGQTLTTTSWDAIVCMKTYVIDTSYICCVSLTLEVIRGRWRSNLDHRKSNLDNNTQGCNFWQVYSYYYLKQHNLYEFDLKNH